jgi:hypothetical protein
LKLRRSPLALDSTRAWQSPRQGRVFQRQARPRQCRHQRRLLCRRCHRPGLAPSVAPSTLAPSSAAPTPTPSALPPMAGPSERPSTNPTALPSSAPTLLSTTLPTLLPVTPPPTAAPTCGCEIHLMLLSLATCKRQCIRLHDGERDFSNPVRGPTVLPEVLFTVHSSTKGD